MSACSFLARSGVILILILPKFWKTVFRKFSFWEMIMKDEIAIKFWDTEKRPNIQKKHIFVRDKINMEDSPEVLMSLEH
jgi:hypothetical protein